jgi:hypothetical protein
MTVRFAGVFLISLALGACEVPRKSDQTHAMTPVERELLMRGQARDRELPPPVGVFVPLMPDKSRTIAI